MDSVEIVLLRITNLVADAAVSLRSKRIDTLWILMCPSNLFVIVFEELGLYSLVSGKLCISSGFATSLRCISDV